jgi:hypothetical protein
MEVNVMSNSGTQDIYNGRPLTQYEERKMMKRRGNGFYADLVKEFWNSKKAMWAYPVPLGVNWGTYYTGFRKVVYRRYPNISVHIVKDNTGYIVILKREE